MVKFDSYLLSLIFHPPVGVKGKLWHKEMLKLLNCTYHIYKDISWDSGDKVQQDP